MEKKSQAGRCKPPIPANPAKLAQADAQKKHDKWKKTWKPHRDPAAAWL